VKSAIYTRAIIAFLITLSAGYYQRLTGPTHPISIDLEWQGEKIAGKLTRSHGDNSDQPIEISVPDTSIHVILMFRRYPANDKWKGMMMSRENDILHGSLPHQPPAGKIEYYLQFKREDAWLNYPQEHPVITRFTGEVPSLVLGSHIIIMFLAMFFSSWAGLEAVFKKDRMYKLALWTTGLLFLGGMILGPVVQRYAFGEFWTGVPFGFDLTDNKTLVTMLFWIVASWVSYKKNQKARLWIIIAAVVLLLVYSIPHSMMGSELDYETGKIGTAE
jgi:hypothetical protein